MTDDELKEVASKYGCLLHTSSSSLIGKLDFAQYVEVVKSAGCLFYNEETGQNEIYISKKYSQQEKEAVLFHELGHKIQKYGSLGTFIGFMKNRKLEAELAANCWALRHCKADHAVLISCLRGGILTYINNGFDSAASRDNFVWAAKMLGVDQLIKWTNF